MKKWVNAYAPIFNIQGVKIATIPEKSIVISHEYVDDFRGVPREAVSYVTDARQFNGYVYVGYLEPYVENFPIKCVPMQSATPSLSDAEQYAIIHGVKQTELCGELCAAFLLGIPLEDLLAEWERESLTIYQRVFNWFTTKKARGEASPRGKPVGLAGSVGAVVWLKRHNSVAPCRAAQTKSPRSGTPALSAL